MKLKPKDIQSPTANQTKLWPINNSLLHFHLFSRKVLFLTTSSLVLPIQVDFFFFKFYFWEKVREKEHEWGERSEGQGEADSSLSTEPHGCKTRSQDPGIMTWAEGRCLTNWATQAPLGRKNVKQAACSVWNLTWAWSHDSEIMTWAEIKSWTLD